MPANELVVDQRCRRREIALAPLLQEQCEEVDLEEEVAELVEKQKSALLEEAKNKPENIREKLVAAVERHTPPGVKVAVPSTAVPTPSS